LDILYEKGDHQWSPFSYKIVFSEFNKNQHPDTKVLLVNRNTL